MEEYLAAIYILQAEGVSVSPSKLADYLQVSRPTVTQTVHRMEKANYVERGNNKVLVLTAAGKERAEAVVRKHRLIERWLSDELGLDWADAHVEAGRLEHAISPLVEERLWEKLGHPTACPHGNLIPGSGAEFNKGTPLTEVTGSVTVQMIRIMEQAEEDLDLLRFLHAAGFIPGAKLHLTGNSNPYEAGIQVTVGEESFSLERRVAERIIVEIPSDSVLQA
ncbi:metal-dependent transcriptional regulator [Alicyclobacillus sp. SO9]|nr:metal-dependent transcriptional regulator [Alicyclobacillus sp. SO9]